MLSYSFSCSLSWLAASPVCHHVARHLLCLHLRWYMMFANQFPFNSDATGLPLKKNPSHCSFNVLYFAAQPTQSDGILVLIYRHHNIKKCELSVMFSWTSEWTIKGPSVMLPLNELFFLKIVARGALWWICCWIFSHTHTSFGTSGFF